jgi:hypothetical protein
MANGKIPRNRIQVRGTAKPNAQAAVMLINTIAAKPRY